MRKLAVDTVPPDTTLADDGGWVGMTVRWIFTDATAGAEQMTFNVTSFEPGGAHELHRHPGCEELLYIVEGGGTCLMEDGETPITAGEVCFVPRGEWHGFRNSTDVVTRVICCYGGAGSLERAGYELMGAGR